MNVTLTRIYPISASFSRGSRVIGRNYRLAVCVDAVDEKDELRLDGVIRKDLIERLHTRDWDESPAFMVRAGREDHQILSALAFELRTVLAEFRLRRVELWRDEASFVSMEFT